MRKGSILLLVLLFALKVFSQTAGDYRSVASGNWDDLTIWEVFDGTTWQPATNLPDTNANLVTIQNGTTVSLNVDAQVKNILIEAGGILQTAGTGDTLDVYGDFINNGTVDFYVSSTDYVVLRFSGNKNSNFTTGSATTDIYQVFMAKESIDDTVFFSADLNFSIQGSTVSAPTFLIYSKGGTFVLGGTVAISSFVFEGASITLDANSGFWLNNPNFEILPQAGNFNLYGTLHISQGIFNIGDGANKSLVLQNNAVYIQDGGTVNIDGGFYAGAGDAITFNMSGGTLNIAEQIVTTSYYYVFRIDDAAAKFYMSGGTIILHNANDGDPEYYVNPSITDYSITGGAVYIGSANTNTYFDFYICGLMPSVVVDNTTNPKNAILFHKNTTDQTYIFGDLTIMPTSSLQVLTPTTASENFELYVFGNILADGDIDGYISNLGYTNTLTLILKGTTNTTISGTGTLFEIYKLVVDKGSDKTPTAELLRSITLIDGDATVTNHLYIANGTLKISADNVWNPYYGTNTVTESTGRLWLNSAGINISHSFDGSLIFKGDLYIDAGNLISRGHLYIDTSAIGSYIASGSLQVQGFMDIESDFTVNGGTLQVDSTLYIDGNGANEKGQLTINAGTVNIGNGDDYLRLIGDTGDEGYGAKFTLNGGTVNVKGAIKVDNGVGRELCYFEVSGGKIYVDPQDVRNLSTSADIVYFADNSIVNFTGGQLIFVDPQADMVSGADALDIAGTTGTKNFIGSKISFGDGVSASVGDEVYKGFLINITGVVLLDTVELNNPAGDRRNVILKSSLYVNQLFIKTADDTLVLNGNLLEVRGNFVNDGNLDGRVVGSHLKFAGSVEQTYSGTGAVLNYLDQLTFDNKSSTGVVLQSNIGALTVNLVDGKVYTTSTGLLTVYGSAVNSLVGGNDTVYVQSTLRRAIASGQSSVNYVFPVGSATSYRALEFFNLTTGGTGDGFITVYVSEPQNPTINGTAGTGVRDPLNMKDIYWQMTFDLANVTINATPRVKLYYDASGLPPFVIAQSNNNINGTYNSIGRILGTGTISSSTYDLTGLVPTGDAYLILAQIQPLQGVYTVGATGDFLNLTEIADTLRKNYIQGYVIFELLADYDDLTETIPIVFDTVMKSYPTDAVLIRPQSGVTAIETSRDAIGALIVFDGVESIRFDGRAGSSGSPVWSIINTNADIVFEFKNGAQYDTLSYLIIKSDIQSPIYGLINFNGTNLKIGNKHNVVMNCDITGNTTTPIIGISSWGNGTYPNDSNKVEACNIYDFFSATENPYAIYLADGSNYWTIANNRIYQTTARSFSEQQIYAPIFINTGVGHIIDGNVIGYADNAGNGQTNISGPLAQFVGIYLNAGSGDTIFVKNNIIDGITFSTTYTDSWGSGAFSAIYIADNNAGIYKIGQKNAGNIIGNPNANASISISLNGSGHVYGIKSQGTNYIEINYNKISGIYQDAVNAGDNLYFYGIYVDNGQVKIDGNLIGSRTVANNIQIGTNGTTASTYSYVYGILSDNPLNTTISNNTIANISNYAGYAKTTSVFVVGIRVTDGSSLISNNVIYSLINSSAFAGYVDLPNVAGITKTSAAPAVIEANEIYALKSIYDNNAGLRIAGISAGTDHANWDTIRGNFVHNLEVDVNNNWSIIYGIVNYSGNYVYYNNMIALGIRADGTDMTNSAFIFAIYDITPDQSELYHNSVYIGGQNVIYSGYHTYCYYKEGTNFTKLKNNIFYNSRSNADAASTSQHLAIALSSEEVVEADYNLYYVDGTGGNLAYIDNNILSSMRELKAYTNDNLHSGFGNPNFVSPNGDTATCNLHINSTVASPIEGTGLAIPFITTDFDGEDRATLTPTDIGADAGNYLFDATVDVFAPTFKYTPIEPQNCGTTSLIFQVTIEDQGTGVSTTNPPVLYFRDKTLDWSTATKITGTLVSGTANSGLWEFNVSPLNDGIIYEYYIVAQDQATTINIGYSKFSATAPVHSDVNTVVTPPDNTVPIDVFSVCVYPKSVYYVGNATDCPTCDFQTLTGYGDLFYNLSAMTIDKEVICYISANTDETGDYGLTNLKYDISIPGSRKIYILPDPNITDTVKVIASSTVNKALIRIEGADSVIIDGLLNGKRWLTFIHNKPDQPVLVFSNDAAFDTVRNVNLIGSGTLDPRGIIFFDSTAVSGGVGNHDIVIENDSIAKLPNQSPPLNAIFNYGSKSAPNHNIKIVNTIISSYKKNGIKLSEIGTGDNWIIQNCQIFNAYKGGDSLQSAITILGGQGHSIIANKIGGNAPNLNGYTHIDGNLYPFYAIYLKVGETNATTLRDNIIKNFDATYLNGYYDVMAIKVDSGLVNISFNTIDSFATSRASNLVAIYYAGKTGTSIDNNTISRFIHNANGDNLGIYVRPKDQLSTVNITNNTLKAFSSLSATVGADMTLITMYNADGLISTNTFGGANATDAINYSSLGNFKGIYIYSTNFASDITANTFTNITTSNTSASYAIQITNAKDLTPFNISTNVFDNITFTSSTGSYLIYISDGNATVASNQFGQTTGLIGNGTAPFYLIYARPQYDNITIASNTFALADAQTSLTGIYASMVGSYDITISANQFSNFSITNDIPFVAIHIDGGNNVNVDNNVFNNISMTNTGLNTSFTAIRVTAGNNVNIGLNAANTIGDPNQTNTINVAGEKITAISLENTAGQVTVKSNLIANLTLSGTSTTGFIAGIYANGDGTKTIYGNTITNLTSSSQKTDITDGIFAAQAIHFAGNSISSVDSNLITNITSNSTVAVNVAGITENATNVKITKNKIYNLTNGSGGNVAAIALLNLSNGFVANNMISLGANDGTEYIGIWIPQANANTKRIFFNSIYIGGTATAGNSYAFLRGNNSTPLYVRNNIFANFRTGGTGKHYAVATLNTTDWIRSYMDANNYYSATATTVGLWGTTDTDFDTWITNTGEADMHLSTPAQPNFVDPVNCDLHLADYANACAWNYVGEPIADVTEDFDGDARSPVRPDIGADEFNPTGRSGPYVWRGWNSNNWDDPLNWQCEVNPPDGLLEDVIVYDMPNDPVIDRKNMANPVILNALTIYPNASLTIMPKSALTLQGALTLNGSIIIESFSNNDTVGSLIDNGTITGTGNLIAKRYINKNQWHEVSAPISSADATSAIFTRSHPTGVFNPNLYYYDESTDLDGNTATAPAGPFNSDYLAKGWVFAHNGETGPDINLIENQGYLFWTDKAQIIEFIGTPNTGTFDATLSYTANDPYPGTLPDLYDGWNLLGNPYPSYLNWDWIRDDQITGVDDAIYVWDNGQYAGYVGGVSVMSGRLSNLIPPMQGFFVHATASGGIVQIRNEHRVHGNQMFLRKNKENQIPNLLKLKLSANGYDDYFAVRFLPDATEEYDGSYDALRMFTNVEDIPQLFALTSGRKDPLALTALPLSSLPNRTIQLGINIGKPSVCKLSVTLLNGFDSINVWLEDKKEAKYVNLRVIDEYEFSFDGGDDRERFVLHFGLNHAPILNNSTVEAIAYIPKVVNIGEVFYDPDTADVLTISQADSLEFLNIDRDRVLILADDTHIGEHLWRVRVKDALGLEAGGEVVIRILPNRSPYYLLSSFRFFVYEGTEFRLDLDSLFADPDIGDSLSFVAYVDSSEWVVYDSESNQLIAKPDYGDSLVSVKVKVYDLANNELVVDLVFVPMSYEDRAIWLYPNPAMDKVRIVMPYSSAVLRIWDLNGRLVRQLRVNFNSEIDLKGLPAGTYIFELKDYGFEAKLIKVGL